MWLTNLRDIKFVTSNNHNPLTQLAAIKAYDAAALKGSVKQYPSLELVRLEKLFFKNSKGILLEYGFGGGCNTIHLLKCGYDLYGIDVAPNAVKNTKKRIKENKKLKNPNLLLLEKDARKLPFEDNKFDYIVAMSVLSLLGSEEKVKYLFSEFKRVLKPSGKIIMDINDYESEFSKNNTQVEKNIFSTNKTNDQIRYFCLKTVDDFENLIKPYFNVMDKGFSSHQVFGRKITEFIICATNNK